MSKEPMPKVVMVVGRCSFLILGVIIVFGCVWFMSESGRAVKKVTSPTKTISKTVEGEKIEITKHLKGTKFPILIWIPVIVGQVVVLGLGIALATFCLAQAFK